MLRGTTAIMTGVVVIAAAGTPLWAQRGENPRQRVQNRFEASGLEQGSQFPDVEIYDANGNPFRTGALQGGYKVLVTGCLT